ncbi:MAG: hypothetical protein ACK54C_10405 [Betaproteobacteria bacterium]|jgi:hypothetical protein
MKMAPKVQAMTRVTTVASVGLAFGAVALLLSGILVSGAKGSGWFVLVVASALAAAVVAVVLWWTLSRAGRVPTIGRGALAGTAVGLLAHPLMWLFALLLAHISGWRGSLGNPTASSPQALAAIPALTFVSWLLFGWLTAPVGALTGGLIALLQRRLCR